MRGNTIHIAMAQGKVRQSLPLWQYDYGQVLILDGLELPAAYEVHFAADESGNSVTQIGGENGVSIPDSLLQTGNPIHAWLYLHAGENDGETEVHGVIPVIRRAKPTNATPTPVQQDVITETIAALNAAVAEAEGIAEAIPGTVNEALEAAKESGEFDGADGVSPSVTITSITGGHRVTIVDADGTHTADVMDGEDGQDGRNGTDGKDGVDGHTPVLTSSKSGKVTTIFADGSQLAQINDGIDGQNGQDGKDGQDGAPGQDGQDGYSPSASVTKSGSTATISITDANGTTTAEVSDGSALIDDTAGTGDTGKAWSADKVTSELSGKYEKPSGGIPASDLASGVIPSVPVTDVQVNGSSVLSNGVANVPIASTGGVKGVVTIDSTYGIGANANGRPYIQKASDTKVKAGTEQYQPIVPEYQHRSVFYGLAKSAGDTTQSSSSNAVGVYTDDAKKKIRMMLGIPNQKWEKIAEYTVAENSDYVIVNTDSNGQSFKLSEMFVRVWFEASTTGSNDYISAMSQCTNINDSGASSSLPTVRFGASGAKIYAEYSARLITDVHIGEARSASVAGSTGNVMSISPNNGVSIKSINGIKLQKYSTNTTQVPKDTLIVVYGIRIDE